jgi:hypothetical protein
MRLSFLSCLRSARLTVSREEPEEDELDSKETLSVTFSCEAVLVAKELAEMAEVGSFSSSLEASCKSKRSLIQPCGPSLGLWDRDDRWVCGLGASTERGGVSGGST